MRSATLAAAAQPAARRLRRSAIRPPSPATINGRDAGIGTTTPPADAMVTVPENRAPTWPAAEAVLTVCPGTNELMQPPLSMHQKLIPDPREGFWNST